MPLCGVCLCMFTYVCACSDQHSSVEFCYFHDHCPFQPNCIVYLVIYFIICCWICFSEYDCLVFMLVRVFVLFCNTSYVVICFQFIFTPLFIFTFRVCYCTFCTFCSSVCYALCCFWLYSLTV